MRKTKKLKGIWGDFHSLLVVFSTVFGAFTFGSLANAAKAQTGLNELGNYTIPNEVSAVWGLNSTSHTWYDLTFTKGATSITFATPLGQQINEILIQTKNMSQDAFHLLQNGLLYQYVGISLTGTKINTNLSDAYMYLGTAVNASGTTSATDKGITGYAMNQTLYNSQVSNLGTGFQLNPVKYFASDITSTAQYAIYLNENKNGTGVYSPVTVTFTQYFEYSQKLPLYDYNAFIGLLILALAFVVTYYTAPEHWAEEESRAGRQQAKRELPWAIVGLAIYGVIFAIIGVMGMFTPLFGYGGALAFIFGAGLFIFAYTELPKRQRYDTTLGWGAIGGSLFVVLNLFVPFGTIAFNMIMAPG
ncbi:MAG: hypothetical protein M1162_05450, partial [Candidatus Thermoplasmatota archaeon]|nr:hypothetical protein [Candidatus Thermoplasmatota archaeon]